MAYRSTIETLGDLRSHGMALFGHCGALYAGHGRLLDLDKLIRLFGEDHVYINDPEIGRKFVCLECGHVGGSITVMANTAVPNDLARPVPAATVDAK
ncbi:hypothetical protein [Mesorhizobium sp. ES1-1]|uniref:hypothetical protein n=1 Tax=Mesorhizobium sp. ES1-1 TaxID=2876629 RepID=UPI001CCA792C|nr:hypothetical protein [Mesorhizobium sp. ES1-1]MBZ9678939.1 hypothetical protein [Mesorhizobium sp. ES1-1]